MRLCHLELSIDVACPSDLQVYQKRVNIKVPAGDFCMKKMEKLGLIVLIFEPVKIYVIKITPLKSLPYNCHWLPF